MNKSDLPDEPGSRKKGKRQLTAEAKKAMAAGRERSRIVDLYLKSLEIHKYQKRAKMIDRRDIESKINKIDDELAGAVGVAKLLLTQSRLDLVKQLTNHTVADEFEQLEAAFISVAAQFSIEREISYETWRDMGVPMRTLAKAGMYPPTARRTLLPHSNKSD